MAIAVEKCSCDLFDVVDVDGTDVAAGVRAFTIYLDSAYGAISDRHGSKVERRVSLVRSLTH